MASHYKGAAQCTILNILLHVTLLLNSKSKK